MYNEPNCKCGGLYPDLSDAKFEPSAPPPPQQQQQAWNHQQQQQQWDKQQQHWKQQQQQWQQKYEQWQKQTAHPSTSGSPCGPGCSRNQPNQPSASPFAGFAANFANSWNNGASNHHANPADQLRTGLGSLGGVLNGALGALGNLQGRNCHHTNKGGDWRNWCGPQCEQMMKDCQCNQQSFFSHCNCKCKQW